MACHPKLTVARVKAHRRSLCELWWASFACIRERRMERETGIEPATNSLEGCDSTTELLPPSYLLQGLRPRTPNSLTRSMRLQSKPLSRVSLRSRGSRVSARSLRPYSLPNFSLLANRSSEVARAAEDRRLVAREGFEPSKPLGRQIYSLLRLTASLPRQNLRSTPRRDVTCYSSGSSLPRGSA